MNLERAKKISDVVEKNVGKKQILILYSKFQDHMLLINDSQEGYMEKYFSLLALIINFSKAYKTIPKSLETAFRTAWSDSCNQNEYLVFDLNRIWFGGKNGVDEKTANYWLNFLKTEDRANARVMRVINEQSKVAYENGYNAINTVFNSYSSLILKQIKES